MTTYYLKLFLQMVNYLNFYAILDQPDLPLF